jgi:stage V sporulation protein D (sporulation-specific penicillin-binding protein)
MHLFRNNNHQISSVRINILQGGIFFLMLLMVAKLFYVQIIQHDYYAQQGAEQRSVIRDIQPERGRIFSLTDSVSTSDLYPLAVNKVYYEVGIDPSKIDRPQNLTDIFVEMLELEEEEVLAKVKKDSKRYELIAKEVPREKAEELQNRLEELRFDINKERSEEEQFKNLEEVGISFTKHVLRFYPDRDIGAHVLGFLGYGNDGYSRVGKYGLEGYFEGDLAGNFGQVIGETDIAGRLLADNDGKPVQNGADLVLTIDRTVQYATCKALEKAVARYEAESGTVIIMDTETGAIRAMCNYPSFDPNNYSEVESADVFNNNATYHAYEPGSVMKSIAMAIAIDQGKVSPDSTYNDEGEIKFAGGQVIRNAGSKKYGWVDMKEVLAASINTGIIDATSDINNKIFEDYMQKFGFGEKVGVNISQDSKGDISSLSKRGDIYKATGSYGQGLTVSPLQMVNAINAVANRGRLVQPYIVSQIRYSDDIVEDFEPEVIREVISSGTAAQISAMMVNVVDSGHAAKAAVEGYYVAGKTGTAQVANPDTGRYFVDKTIHNFVGFAPNENPKFTMITKLDYPSAARYSADTAAPLFGEIAKFLLEYYQIPPNR